MQRDQQRLRWLGNGEVSVQAGLGKFQVRNCQVGRGLLFTGCSVMMHVGEAKAGPPDGTVSLKVLLP